MALCHLSIPPVIVTLKWTSQGACRRRAVALVCPSSQSLIGIEAWRSCWVWYWSNHSGSPYRRLTFRTGLSPPPNASGSTVLKPLCRPLLLRLSRRTGLCSSITSTISSSLSSLTGLLVSSMITGSLRLDSLRGGGAGLRERDRSLVRETSMTSLLE